MIDPQITILAIFVPIIALWVYLLIKLFSKLF